MTDPQPTAPAGLPCDTCALSRADSLRRLGVNVESWDFVVAMAGNPNTGKSTVFNALTGLRQHTGNWPGKTVTRAEGGYAYGGKRYKLVDLPGTYSLLPTSIDEEIARDFILFGQPDVTVVVVDAGRLERNLNLVLQVLAITDRVVLCLNLMDEARRHGLKIDDRQLARDLGIPVVPTTARSEEGLGELVSTIAAVATGEIQCHPYRARSNRPEVESAVDRMARVVAAEFPDLPQARWIAERLLDGDNRIIEAIRRGEIGSLARTSEARTAESAS